MFVFVAMDVQSWLAKPCCDSPDLTLPVALDIFVAMSIGTLTSNSNHDKHIGYVTWNCQTGCAHTAIPMLHI